MFKGSYVCSYVWDKIAGHFPNVRQLAESNGMELRGHSEDRDLADAVRGDMIKEQKEWFGDRNAVIDVNKELGKSVITTLEFSLFLPTIIFSPKHRLSRVVVFPPNYKT